MTAQFGAALAEALPRLRRYAIALAGDLFTADDLVQDCIERAWKNRSALRDERPIFAWLRAILHNVNIDRVWLRGAFGRGEQDLSNGATGDELARSMDFARAMNRLTVEHRQVPLLIGLESLSYREIAGELGIPVGTVMSRLARARERLRALLEDRR